MKQLLIIAAFFSCFFLWAFKPAKHTFGDIDYSLGYTPRDTFPNKSTVGSDSAKYTIRGMMVGGQGSQFTPYNDTSSANLSPVHSYAGAAISVKGELYIRDSTKTKWVKQNANGGSTISVYQDSLLVICNLNSCDTINTHIVINNWRIEGDTSIIVCPASGSCDTIIINPTPFNKSYQDSTIVQNSTDGSCIDTISYYINGNRFIGGYINHCTLDTIYTKLPIYVYTDSLGHQVIAIQQQDGIIGTCPVIWDSLLVFHTPPCNYVIGGNFYSSPFNYITLDSADATNSRYDLFIVDTFSRSTKITGVPSPTPTIPQADPSSQLALTSGFLVNPGDTVPNKLQSISVWDENLGVPTEWALSTTGTLTENANNTDKPKHLTKAIFVSKYNNGSSLKFLSASTDTVKNGQVLSFWIYLNGALNSNYFRISFLKGSTAVTNSLNLRNIFGLNPNDSNVYQPVAIPLSVFNWTGGNVFDGIRIQNVGTDTSGAKGYYLDWITLQTGILPIPSPTDYSNKQDSNSLTKTVVGSDTLNVINWWVKGIPHALAPIYTHSGGGTTERFGIEDSIGIQNRYNALGDFNIDLITGTPDFSGQSSELYLSKFGNNLTVYNDPTTYTDLTFSGTNGQISTINGSSGSTFQTAYNQSVITSYNPTVTSEIIVTPTTLQAVLNGGGNKYIPLSVNGNNADSTGNITISTGGTGGISKLGSPTYGLIKVNDSTYKADSATLSLYYLRLKDSTAGGYYPYSSNPLGYLTSVTGLTRQVITSGTTATVTGGNYVVTIDPAATIASFTLTMPASPSDLQTVEVVFGGTLTSGLVVTSLTISPNTGQTIQDNTPPGSATADNTLYYRYYSSKTAWKRIKL